jgi:hypothetical protein
MATKLVRIVVLLAVIACGGSDPQAPETPDRVSVSPSSLAFQSVGDTVVLTAQALTSSGAVLTGIPFSFSSASPNVATVDGNGRVVSVANGSTTINVSAGSVSAVVNVTVAQVATALSSAPTSLTLFAKGDTARIIATARDLRGNAISGLVASWTSANPAVATVSGGLVTAVADGTTEIVAGYQSLSATIPVTVTRRLTDLRLPGDTLAIDALGVTATAAVIARDANGNDLSGLAFTWQTSDTNVVRVAPNGVLTSVGNGTAQVRVRAGSLEAVRPVRVFQQPASMTFSTPPSPFLVEGETLGTFTVEARDRNSVVLQQAGLSMTVTLQAPSPNAGKLVGTLSRPVVSGAAEFTGLVIDRSGPGYRVTATLGSHEVQSPPIDVALKLVSLDNVEDAFCGRDIRADLWCWGINVPPLPSLPLVATPRPVRLGNVAFNYIITIGDGRQCGVLVGETMRCWGNEWGAAPAAATAPTTLPISQFSASHHCGLDAMRRAWCFGPPAEGSPRGTGASTNFHPDSATAVTGNHTFSQIAVSGFSTCGVKPDATLFCWGYNQAGQLGIPNTNGSVGVPTQVGPLGTPYAAVEIESSYTCGLTTLGRLYCWGSNIGDKFGNPYTLTPSYPSPFFIPSNENFKVLNVGDHAACALSQSGQAFCWGANTLGNLGRGNIGGPPSITPNPVVSGERFVDLAGKNSTCGLTARGLVYCWGIYLNDKGEFEIGATRSFPTGTVFRANTIVP